MRFMHNACATTSFVERHLGLDRQAKKFQVPIGPNASRMGAGESRMTPLKGIYISMMMKTAAETASAQTTNVTITVWLCGAKRPKLRKMEVSHATTTTRRGNERELCSALR